MAEEKAEKEVKTEYELKEVSTDSDVFIYKDGKPVDIRVLVVELANKIERAGLK